MKLKKICCAFLILVMGMATFTGCTKDEVDLMGAIIKVNEIKSMESTTDIAFNLEVEGLSEEDAISSKMVIDTINSAKIKVDTKLNANEDKTKSIAQVDISADVQATPISTTIWVDTDLSGDNPNVTEIIKIPAMVKGFLPEELQGKEYILYDFSKLVELDEEVKLDLAKSKDLIMKYQGKFIEAFDKFVKNYDSDTNVVKYVGNKTVNGEKCKVYELKFDDASFKKFLQNTINAMLKDEGFTQLIKEYSMEIASSWGLSTAVVNKELDGLFNEIPKLVKESDKIFKAFKDVKIIGEDGLNVKYVVNAEGYIISKDADINLVFDINGIGNAINVYLGKEKEDLNTEVLKLNIKSSTDISKVNKEVKIEVPNLTKENSIDIVETMKEESQVHVTEMTEIETKAEEIKKDISVVLDESKIEFDVKPQIVNNTTLLPIKAICDALGAETKWDKVTRSVNIKKDDSEIVLKIDSDKATVNGEEVTLETPAIIIDGRTMVPVRFVAETFGYDVAWDQETKTVELNSKK